MKKVFLFTLELTSNDWDYEPGMKIIVPVVSSSAYHAEMKLENRHNGSEYPAYKIVSIQKCDDWLFKPLL